MATQQKAMNKSQLAAALAERTELSKTQVNAVLAALGDVMKDQLGSNPHAFILPGLVKLSVVKKPAVPAREGIDPFTKQMRMFAAKPARNVVKARPLKALKDAV